METDTAHGRADTSGDTADTRTPPSPGPGGDDRRVGPEELSRHMWRMRTAAIVGLALTAALATAVFVIPARRSPAVPPIAFTLAALAASLWLAFTADRDAARRLSRIRELFPAHGDERRLLRQLLGVYLVVLLRLAAIATCGLVVAVWGHGSTVGIGFCALAGVLMLLAWPTRHKSELLLRRVRERA